MQSIIRLRLRLSCPELTVIWLSLILTTDGGLQMRHNGKGNKLAVFALVVCALSLLLAMPFALCGCGSSASQGSDDNAATQEADSTDDESSESGSALEVIDYTNNANWAFKESIKGTKADVFFVAPAVYINGEDDPAIMQMDDEAVKKQYRVATKMERGIYDRKNVRFMAPYYRQIGLNVYTLSDSECEDWLEVAYADISNAFGTYLASCKKDRPIILAGFSQGADMCLRIVEEYGEDEYFARNFVACYAIGWRVTDDDLEQYPVLQMAEGEDDTGVIVSFDCEAPDTEETLIVPSGVRTHGINPLNWSTSTDQVDKKYNLGARFVSDTDATVGKTVKHLTGAYLDPDRGTLCCTDVTPEDYPAFLDILPEGSYHVYDYMFFYNNLKQNVGVRLHAFMSK